ncbi:unnamed protein product, partial [Coffea canephora]
GPSRGKKSTYGKQNSSHMYDTLEDFLQTNSRLMPIRYSYKLIKTMTKYFEEKLGQGGYSLVYKGKLRSGGRRRNVDAHAEHTSQIYFPSWVYDKFDQVEEMEIGDHAIEEEKTITRKLILIAL